LLLRMVAIYRDHRLRNLSLCAVAYGLLLLTAKSALRREIFDLEPRQELVWIVVAAVLPLGGLVAPALGDWLQNLSFRRRERETRRATRR
jgi:hypothetical protein